MAANDASAAVTQASEDVERIARALYEADKRTASDAARPLLVMYAPWETLSETYKERLRRIVRSMLHTGVIYVGRRPERGEPPMEGQTCLPTT